MAETDSNSRPRLTISESGHGPWTNRTFTIRASGALPDNDFFRAMSLEAERYKGNHIYRDLTPNQVKSFIGSYPTKPAISDGDCCANAKKAFRGAWVLGPYGITGI